MSHPTNVRRIDDLDLDSIVDPAARKAFRLIHARVVAREEDADMANLAERERTIVLVDLVGDARGLHERLTESNERLTIEIRSSSAARRRDTRWTVSALRTLTDKVTEIESFVKAAVAHMQATGERHERRISGLAIAKGTAWCFGGILVTGLGSIAKDLFFEWLKLKGHP